MKPRPFAIVATALSSIGCSCAFSTGTRHITSRRQRTQSISSFPNTHRSTSHEPRFYNRKTATYMLPLEMAMDPTSFSSQMTSLVDVSTLPVNLLSAMPSSTMLAQISADPLREAEVLYDASHLLSIATYFTPGTSVLKLFTMLSQILGVAGDYLPDKSISLEEAVFQSAMIGASFSVLAKNALSVGRAMLKPTTFRDRKAYNLLFRRSGVSWMQFKALAANALEWVEVQPGSTINQDEDDSVYWLYRGDTKLTMNGSTVQCWTRKSDQQPGIRMLGTMKLAQALEGSGVMRTKKSKREGPNAPITNVKDRSIIEAGPSGATLLRMDIRKLQDLIKHDEQLLNSMRSILFASLDEKISALLAMSANSTTC